MASETWNVIPRIKLLGETNEGAKKKSKVVNCQVKIYGYDCRYRQLFPGGNGAAVPEW
jgi:hypothetical protein